VDASTPGPYGKRQYNGNQCHFIKWGSQELRKKYVPIALAGEKLFAFSLSEPDFGSDAANIKPVPLKKTMDSFKWNQSLGHLRESADCIPCYGITNHP